MDAAQKAGFEKKVIIGLLCLFAVRLVRALRESGLLGARPGPAPVVRASKNPSTIKTFEAIEEKVLSAAPVQPAHGTPSAPLYTAQDLRDPMESLLPPEPKPELSEAEVQARQSTRPPLRLQGLVWGGKKPQAIINSRLYRVGESVEGSKILSIDRTGVTIEHYGHSALYSTATAVEP
jgi:hypothetical protein